jgi:hypothetical protein
MITLAYGLQVMHKVHRTKGTQKVGFISRWADLGRRKLYFLFIEFISYGLWYYIIVI